MTDMARIRHEIELDLGRAHAGTPDDEAHSLSEDRFDAELEMVLQDAGLSDAAIEYLIEAGAASSSPFSPSIAAVDQALASVPATMPNLKAARERRGITVERASRTLGNLAPNVVERLETEPGLRWLNIAPELVATYLDLLGISRGLFVRALTPQIRAFAGEHPWGYRPGSIANVPLESTDPGELLKRATDWAGPILNDLPPQHTAMLSTQEVLGFEWSPSEVDRRTRMLERTTHKAILDEPMLSDPEIPWAQLSEAADGLLVLLTNHGRRVPAFQFTHERQLKPVVEELNRLLGAAEDPWGAASWWLSPSGYLGHRPIDVVDAPNAGDRLRAAIRFLDADPG